MKKEITARPAGTTAAISTLAVILANKILKLHLDPTEAVAIVGGLTAIVSLITPRWRRTRWEKPKS